MGKQGAGTFTNSVPWIFSAGGQLLDFKTGEVFINDDRAAAGLQFYADLALKDKVVPPEAMTWEFDEIIAGAQKDRYAMSVTFSSYSFSTVRITSAGMSHSCRLNGPSAFLRDL